VSGNIKGPCPATHFCLALSEGLRCILPQADAVRWASLVLHECRQGQIIYRLIRLIIMSYRSVVNTAISYFAMLGSFIDDEYTINPSGIVYPEAVALFIRSKKVVLTQGALKANVWVFDKLSGILAEMDKDYKPLDPVADSEYIFERYKGITYNQYIYEENMKQLEISFERWKQRAQYYSLKGDDHSRIFCERQMEDMAFGLATGQQVALFKNTPSRIEYLDRFVGKYNPNLIDPSLFKYLSLQ